MIGSASKSHDSLYRHVPITCLLCLALLKLQCSAKMNSFSIVVFIILLGSFQSLSEFVSNVYGGKFSVFVFFFRTCEIQTTFVHSYSLINHSCCDKSHRFIFHRFASVSSILNHFSCSRFIPLATKEEMKNSNTVTAKGLSPEESRKRNDALQSQVEALQTEMMNVQIKYQKELEKLEKENRELRQQYLILKTNRKTMIGKKIKVHLATFDSFVCIQLLKQD